MNLHRVVSARASVDRAYNSQWANLVFTDADGGRFTLAVFTDAPEELLTQLATRPSSIYEERLLAVLDAVRDYLPPDGVSAHETLGRIIGLVDPWPTSTARQIDADAAPQIDQQGLHALSAQPAA